MVKTASHPITVSRSVAQILLLSCGILASVLFTATYLIEGALHPGYDLMRQTKRIVPVSPFLFQLLTNACSAGLLIISEQYSNKGSWEKREEEQHDCRTLLYIILMNARR